MSAQGPSQPTTLLSQPHLVNSLSPPVWQVSAPGSWSIGSHSFPFVSVLSLLLDIQQFVLCSAETLSRELVGMETAHILCASPPALEEVSLLEPIC